MPRVSEPPVAYQPHVGRRALLDVNVLIALLDAAHVHHRVATAWLSGQVLHGWASCALTQLGCIRIMSRPAYPQPLRTAEVAERLRHACRHPAHAFWTDDVEPVRVDGVQWRHVIGPRQLTDIHLLALAVRHGGRFVTFDRRIDLAAVEGAQPDQLAIIGD